MVLSAKVGAPLRGFLFGASDGSNFDIVLLELADDSLSQLYGSGGVAVHADRVRGYVYVAAVHGGDLAFGQASDDPVAYLLRVQFLGHLARKDDLTLVVVVAV